MNDCRILALKWKGVKKKKKKDKEKEREQPLLRQMTDLEGWKKC